MMPATQSIFDWMGQIPEEFQAELELRFCNAILEQVKLCCQFVQDESEAERWGTEVKQFAAHVGRTLTVPEVVKRYHHPYKTAKALALAHLEREGDDVRSLPL